MPPLEEAAPSQPSRGAGGKVKKQFNRRSRTIPYSRPQPNLSQAPIADGGGGGWFSKLVTPARRLISSGASRILPAFWSPAVESSAVSSDDDHETEQDDVEHHGEDETRRESSDVAFSLSHQIPHAIIVEHGSSSNATDGPRDGEARGTPDKDGLVEIEKMIRGKSFSRDEVERLMAILNLKSKDSAKVDGQKLQPIMMEEEVQRPAMAPAFPSKAKEEDQGRLDWERQEILTPLPKSNLRGDIGASPIDIARAYMGSRMSDIGSSSMSRAFEDDKAMVHVGPSKPNMPSPSRKPSTCWPGAMVPNQLLTPQTQRGRYDFHTSRITPYSRSVNSMSKLKLTQLREDGSNSLNITSTPLQQPSTMIGGQVKSSIKASDSHYGSGGPIRRARHQLAAGSPRKFVSFSPLPSPKTDVSLPTLRRKADAVGTSTSKPLSVEDKPQRTLNVPTHSSQMAKQILEHLDRTIATPKDWSAELNRATSVKNPKPSSDVISIGGAPDSQVAADKRNHTAAPLDVSPFQAPPAADTVKGKSLASDKGFAYTIPRSGTDAPKPSENVPKFTPSSTSNYQFQHLLKKPPTPIPIQKSVLPPLRPTKLPSSDNSSGGFTFQVSASPGAFPEPPTPSLMLPPSLLNTQNSYSEVPSFSFGSKSSSPKLVFSFPSTSNAAILNDASSDIKYTFGSDKARIDFGSVGKDNAVCC